MSIPRLAADITREGPDRLSLGRVLKTSIWPSVEASSAQHSASRCEQFKPPRNAGSRPDEPFFNTHMELDHNLGGVSSRMPCAAQGIPSGFFGEALNGDIFLNI
jgi:hypothetical protein